MGNWKKFSVVGLILIAIWGAASSVSKAIGCTVCLEILAPFEQNILKVGEVPNVVQETQLVSGTTVE